MAFSGNIGDFVPLIIPPVYIAIVYLAERRFGQRVSGLLTAVPTQTTTVILIVALVGGTAVAGRLAAGAILGAVALSAYAVAYGGSARRAHGRGSRAVPLSLGIGLGAFALSGFVLGSLHGTPAEDAGLALVFIALCIWALAGSVTEGVSTSPPRIGVPLRMVAALLLIGLVVVLTPVLGPVVAGILAVFPVITLPMSVFNHVDVGVGATRVYLEGLEWGMAAVVVYFLVLSELLQPLGVAAAFALAIPLLIVCLVAVYLLRKNIRKLGGMGFGTDRPGDAGG